MLEERGVFQELFEYFGHDNQLLKTVEECGELISALMHFRDNKTDEYTVAGEIADVAIMLEQIKIMIGSEIVDKRIDEKLAKVMPVLEASCREKQQEHEKRNKRKELKTIVEELVSLCALEEYRFHESPQYDWEMIPPRAEKCLLQIKGMLFGGQLFSRQAQVADVLLHLSCCSNKERHRENLVLLQVNEVRSILENKLAELQQ